MGRASALPDFGWVPMKKTIYILIVVALVAVMGVSGFKLYQGLHRYEVIEEYNDTVQKYVVSSAPSASPSPKGTKPLVTDETSEIEETVEKADVETAPISIDFAALLQDAPDTVGWLYAVDGSINLPVVQGEDNQFYLTHLPDGEYSYGGSLFLDYLNESDFSDEASFIYGHNMKNGTMLQPLLEYEKQEYYDKYPVMYLLTPEKDYKLELFAGILTDLESDVYTFSFATPEDKENFIDGLVARSTFTPSFVPRAGDRLLCLSTCAYDYNGARYVVFGKLTELGEKPVDAD